MKTILGLLLLISLICLGATEMKNTSAKRTLKIAFNSPWMSIHPGLQHTLIGDLTLSNQFEALVGFNDNGVYVPLAAKEWSVTPDYKKLTFKIDTSKYFSDGVRLSAQHFKDSWENALKLTPKSSNSSLLDVLYKIDGFSDFEKTGTISGINVVDDETLELNFVTPFRMALEHLSGNRFSVFRDVNGKYIGTGIYEIQEINKDQLHLTPNIKYPTPSQQEIELSIVNSKDAVQALLDGKIDVMAYSLGGGLSPNLASQKNLSFVVGQDAAHRAIYPNEQKGRLFSKKEFRQALQYLAFKFYSKNVAALGNQDFTTLDAQVFLPYQAGRVDENLVIEKINLGEKYVHLLQKASKENPLVLIEPEEYSIRPFLEVSGITISPKSRVVTKSELIAAIYAGQEADIIPGAFGVASGDPDGIYHLLGRNGAIASPMLFNEAVANILEEGRKIVSNNEIDAFYKNVSLTILDQVPLVHLGFNKAVAIYRNDKVTVSGRILRRNEGHLNIFEAK